MKIIDVFWTSQINVFVLKCDCGEKFHHRADKWNAKCPKCATLGNCHHLKEKYVGREPENPKQLFLDGVFDKIYV